MPQPSDDRWTRVAAYAVILREGAAGEGEILLSRLAPFVTGDELWNLPGGGVEFGEDPREAVVREVQEETGLDATVSDTAWIDSAVVPSRTGRRGPRHAIRLVFEGRVPRDSPAPRVVEVDGSTVEARWHAVAAVRAGALPATAVVRAALERYDVARVQRLAAYAVCRRGTGDAEEILLTRISPRGYDVGSWTLPGGGVEHGESPAVGLVREVHEETGLDARVGDLIGVHDVHFTGATHAGRLEDFHGVHLMFAAEAGPGEPRVVEQDGTTDAAAWIRVADVRAGALPVNDLVRAALELP